MPRPGSANELHEALLALAWGQWGQLGVAANVGGVDLRCVDPEALFLFSMELLRWEPRMFDEVLDWLDLHGERLIRQRVMNMLPSYHPTTARVAEAALARLPRPAAARRATEQRHAPVGPLIPL